VEDIGSSAVPGSGCGCAMEEGSIEEPQRINCQECHVPVNPFS